MLIGYRAFGDWLYASPVLPYLFNKYDIYFETCPKVHALIHNDPRFKHVYVLPLVGIKPKDRHQAFTERWAKLTNEIKPDKIINLNGSLEFDCISENWQPEFNLPVEERRQKFGIHSFYSSVFKRCELPLPQDPVLNQIYYTPKEIELVEAWKYRNIDKFIIILIIAGSTSQKVLHKFKEWTYIILDRYPKSVMYLGGDATCSELVQPLVGPRIKNMCAPKTPIKQAFLMTKYVNYVVGPETGVVVAAGTWGTPKTMFCTTSSIFQCNQFHKNDFSIQAPIKCSPCHRAIYYKEDCEDMVSVGENFAPKCTQLFNIDSLLQRIDPIYKQFQDRGNCGPHLCESTRPVQNKGGGGNNDA